MIYRLLYALLFNSPAIRSRVSTRIFPEHAPADAKGECIVIRVLSGNAEYGLDGECDAANPTVQLDFYAENSTKAETLYQLGRNRLSGFSGAVDVLSDQGTETPLEVSEITIIRAGSLIDEPRDGSDKWSHRYSADFSVYHEQSVPTLA